MNSVITKDRIQIERTDSIQIETNIQSGVIGKSKIRWISPCEYQIVALASNKLVKDGVDSFIATIPFNVTIINTGTDYYVFKVKFDSLNKHVDYSDTIWVQD